jgi:putative ABC transport system permease protein
LVSLATGVGITLLSAVLPARSAASVPPIAALRDQPGLIGGRSLRIRAIVGVALTGLGVGLLASGLLIEIETEAIPEVALVGAGAGLIFVGVAVLAAVFARPVTTVLGRPLRALGVPGRLAADNAGRNPRRTAATSSALMVGLALVSLTLVMADSVKATAAKLLDDRFRADLVVAPAGFGGGRLSPLVADRLAQLPETHVVARLRAGQVEVNDDTRFLAGADLDLLVQALDFQMVDGDLTAMGDGQVALRKRVADQLGLQVGDTIEIVFARTGRQRLEVGAVWDAEGVGAGLLVSLTTYEANFTEPFDDQVYVVLKDPELGREAVEAVVGEFPGVEVSDQSEFKQQASIQVDQLVRLVFGLLGVAIVIGVLGITNTLSLSVLERTREIGLLRAVGMSRRQMRRAITWESVLIAVFGALLGVTLGLVFGWAVVAALQRDALVLSIPYARLALSVVAAMAAGIGAALLPGWRASRRNILQAIAYE